MRSVRRAIACLAFVGLFVGSVSWPSRSSAYVEAPMSLGAVIAQSSHVMVLRVEKVDKERNLILYRKVKDLKGQHPADVVKHNIGRGGFHPREWQITMEWAAPGKTAIFFHNGGASETCIDNYWYQAYAGGEWWNMSHAEPYLLRSFAGKPDKLASAVTAILAGQEAVVPCMVDGDKNAIQLRTLKLQRMKASLKLQDYNAKRDFVSWGGGEDLRPLAGMPGFSHYGALGRTDPGAGGVAPADFDGDGKPDLCLFGEGKVLLLQNAGNAFNETALPYTGGARSAAWADYNGDGKPDLLLATPAGPRLFTNQGGTFKDHTVNLPRELYDNAAAAVWIDFDADGKPDILTASRFLGLRLYRNSGAAPWRFEDLTARSGLAGAESTPPTLALADVNSDGRTDLLSGGSLFLNLPQGFVLAKDSGLQIDAGSGTPVFGAFNGDKHPDLFVPHPAGCKLFKNDGKGRFTEVTPVELRSPRQAVSAFWIDFDRDGRLDLFVGCLKGPNRFFRNRSDGGLADAGEELGLYQRVFNTRGLCVLDLNGDGAWDLVLNNEGQESAVLLGSAARVAVRGAGK